MSCRFLVKTLVVLGFVGCGRSEKIHVRGDLDRAKWVVRTCDSRKPYRLVMNSGALDVFLRTAREQTIGDSEPIIIEFDGSTIYLPWFSLETVGVDANIHIERGICSSQ